MNIPPPSIVIFDMDGTTVEHLAPWKIGFAEWYDDTTYRISKAFKSGVQALFARKTNRTPRNKKNRLLVHRAIHKMRRKEVDQIVQPSSGVEDLLKFLNAKKIPMALVSNGLGKGYGHDILKTFKLTKYFAVTLFREDIQNAKPHPECLLSALDGIGRALRGDDIIWYIGDRHKDITAAMAANDIVEATVIPVAYRPGSAAVEVAKHFPVADHLILSFDDLREQLEGVL